MTIFIETAAPFIQTTRDFANFRAAPLLRHGALNLYPNANPQVRTT